MGAWHDALRQYRRRSLESGREAPRPVMFVLSSEDAAGAALAAGCNPSLVLQTVAGAREPSCTAVRAAFDHALRTLHVRQVLVCGVGSSAAPAQADAVHQVRQLTADPVVGKLLRAHGVSPRPLWLDAAEGDVYVCNMEGNAPALLSDEAFGKLLEGTRGGC